MNNPTKLMMTICTLALLLLAGCSSEDVLIGKTIEKSKQPLKVGSITALTGVQAFYGVPVAKGLEMAKRDIKAKYGEDVTLIIEDTKSDTKEAVTAAHKLLDVDNVDVLITEFSAPGVAVAPIALESGKLYIYDALTTDPLKTNPQSLKFSFNAYDEYRKLALIAKSRGYSNVAGVIGQGDYNQPTREGILSVFPNAEFHDFDIKTTDLRDILAKVKAGPSQVIFTNGYEQNFLNLFAQKKELGIDMPVYCSTKFSCMGPKTLALGDSTVDGTLTFDYLIRKEFVDIYLAENPGSPRSELNPAATGYDQLMYIYHAARQCPDKEPSCMISAAKKTDYQSQIISTGFGDDRIFKIETIVEEYEDGRFNEVKP